MNWTTLAPEMNRLAEIAQRLLLQWGGFLDPTLYREAITHFLGGPSIVIRPVAVTTVHGFIGSQEVHMVTPDIAFAVTSATHHPEKFAEHQRRFLRSTPLKAMAWINLNHDRIEFQTLVK